MELLRPPPPPQTRPSSTSRTVARAATVSPARANAESISASPLARAGIPADAGVPVAASTAQHDAVVREAHASEGRREVEPASPIAVSFTAVRFWAGGYGGVCGLYFRFAHVMYKFMVWAIILYANYRSVNLYWRCDTCTSLCFTGHHYLHWWYRLY
jgi:hypothetical protein